MANLGLATWSSADGEEPDEYATGLGVLTTARFTYWGVAAEGRRQGLGVTVREGLSYSGPFKANRPDTSEVDGAEGIRIDRQGRCRQQGEFEGGELVRGKYVRVCEGGTVRKAEGSFSKGQALHGQAVLIEGPADDRPAVVLSGQWSSGTPMGTMKRWDIGADGKPSHRSVWVYEEEGRVGLARYYYETGERRDDRAYIGQVDEHGPSGMGLLYKRAESTVAIGVFRGFAEEPVEGEKFLADLNVGRVKCGQAPWASVKGAKAKAQGGPDLSDVAAVFALLSGVQSDPALHWAVLKGLVQALREEEEHVIRQKVPQVSVGPIDDDGPFPLRYSGERDRDRKPHGHGAAILPDRSVYVGQWVHGKRQGEGECVLSESESFVGQWSSDEWAEGRWVNHATGWKVDGSFEAARMPHGFAVLTSPEGVKVEATFTHGRMDFGDVRITWLPPREGLNARIFRGNVQRQDEMFQVPVPQYGTEALPDGRLYEGDHDVQGNRCGNKVLMYYPEDGSVYRGPVRNDKPDSGDLRGQDSLGIMLIRQSRPQMMYRVPWKEGKKHGKGSISSEKCNNVVDVTFENDAEIARCPRGAKKEEEFVREFKLLNEAIVKAGEPPFQKYLAEEMRKEEDKKDKGPVKEAPVQGPTNGQQRKGANNQKTATKDGQRSTSNGRANNATAKAAPAFTVAIAARPAAVQPVPARAVPLPQPPPPRPEPPNSKLSPLAEPLPEPQPHLRPLQPSGSPQQAPQPASQSPAVPPAPHEFPPLGGTEPGSTAPSKRTAAAPARSLWQNHNLTAVVKAVAAPALDPTPLDTTVTEPVATRTTVKPSVVSFLSVNTQAPPQSPHFMIDAGDEVDMARPTVRIESLAAFENAQLQSPRVDIIAGAERGNTLPPGVFSPLNGVAGSINSADNYSPATGTPTSVSSNEEAFQLVRNKKKKKDASLLSPANDGSLTPRANKSPKHAVRVATFVEPGWMAAHVRIVVEAEDPVKVKKYHVSYFQLPQFCKAKTVHSDISQLVIRGLKNEHKYSFTGAITLVCDNGTERYIESLEAVRTKPPGPVKSAPSDPRQPFLRRLSPTGEMLPPDDDGYWQFAIYVDGKEVSPHLPPYKSFAIKARVEPGNGQLVAQFDLARELDSAAKKVTVWCFQEGTPSDLSSRVSKVHTPGEPIHVPVDGLVNSRRYCLTFRISFEGGGSYPPEGQQSVVLTATPDASRTPRVQSGATMRLGALSGVRKEDESAGQLDEPPGLQPSLAEWPRLSVTVDAAHSPVQELDATEWPLLTTPSTAATVLKPVSTPAPGGLSTATTSPSLDTISSTSVSPLLSATTRMLNFDLAVGEPEAAAEDHSPPASAAVPALTIGMEAGGCAGVESWVQGFQNAMGVQPGAGCEDSTDGHRPLFERRAVFTSNVTYTIAKALIDEPVIKPLADPIYDPATKSHAVNDGHVLLSARGDRFGPISPPTSKPSSPHGDVHGRQYESLEDGLLQFQQLNLWTGGLPPVAAVGTSSSRHHGGLFEGLLEQAQKQPRQSTDKQDPPTQQHSSLFFRIWGGSA